MTAAAYEMGPDTRAEGGNGGTAFDGAVSATGGRVGRGPEADNQSGRKVCTMNKIPRHTVTVWANNSQNRRIMLYLCLYVFRKQTHDHHFLY